MGTDVNQIHNRHKVWLGAWQKFLSAIVTPYVCERGKLISSVALGVIVVEDTKFNMAKSGNIGTWVSCKHDKSIKFGQLALCLELISTACKCHNSVFLIIVSCTHQPCPLCIYYAYAVQDMNFLLLCTTGLVCGGKSHQQCMSRCSWGMSSIEL